MGDKASVAEIESHLYLFDFDHSEHLSHIFPKLAEKCRAMFRLDFWHVTYFCPCHSIRLCLGRHGALHLYRESNIFAEMNEENRIYV